MGFVPESYVTEAGERIEYAWLTEMGKQFLERDYLLPGQTLDERVDIICNAAEARLGMPGFAAKFKRNYAKGWYSLSTPIMANFGTDRGLPISCFGSSMEDNMESILYTLAEVGSMTKYGGGTSADFSNLRGRGETITNNGQSSGSVHFMQLFDKLITVVSQGKTRRGNCAAYLSIEHPDIEEFLTIRSEASPIQDLSFGVTVTDAFMQKMIDRDKDAGRVWAKVLKCRANTGFPYIFFEGNANKNKPLCYKDHPITHSNLCAEISLPDNANESFVCDLASMNIMHFDEWRRDPEAVQLLVFLLDAVMSEFIEKAELIQFLERAVQFAKRHRALGVGWLGYHSYLQKHMIPFESLDAERLNEEIANEIRWQATEASIRLVHEFDFDRPEVIDIAGEDRRNTTLTAIAPTKSSAFILGQVSEGIEPHRSNYQVKDLAKGKFTIKNLELEKLLVSLDKNTEEVWDSILERGGSVQHLDFLTDHQKQVFKTFSEIAPMSVLIQASMRQRYIDQGQSLNLMIHPDMPVKDVNALYIFAWQAGIKSLYYQYSVNAAQEFKKSQLDCVACSA